jgi:magnesium-protoporphyrin O-methyltransferase
MFTSKTARRSLKRYQKRGLDALERRMLATVPATALNGASVLEIGGGIGAIQAELLAAGAARGEVVELVAAYAPYARQLVEDKALVNQSTFHVADVIEQPDAVGPATIVVLNRVVCCSPDGVRLAAVAARLSDRFLLLSFPRDRWFVRLVMGLINATERLMGRSFRVFVHPRGDLYAAAEREGFLIADAGQNIAWEFAAFRRVPSSSRLS